jgi:hypothetical protein
MTDMQTRRSLKVFLPNAYTTDFERYTPPVYAELCREVLGTIDLDPGSCELANTVIRARRIFTLADDGLSRPWFGRVFSNPPYGRVGAGGGGSSRQAAWFDHGRNEFEARRAKAIIFLLAADLTNKWMQDRVFDYPMCLVRGRVNFWNAHSQGLHNPRGSCFVYLGPDVAKFRRVFSAVGVLWLP